MTSSCSEIKRLFRLPTEILEGKTLIGTIEQLDLSSEDIIITSRFIEDKIRERLDDVTIISIDAFGEGEPKDTWVNDIIDLASKSGRGRIVAIGGGATIDIAKLCVFSDGRDVDQLFEDKDKLVKKRELIVLPTTCGTGSEVTSVAVLERSRLDSKQGLQVDQMFPDKAILVGELLETLPLKTFYITSIDALSHAIESILSPKATPYTDIFAASAIKSIVENIKESVEVGGLPKDMKKSLIAADMAGIAFSIAGCATMHALSFPLSSRYHMTHGEAIYAVMRPTLEYYKEKMVDLDRVDEILKSSGTDGIEGLMSLLSKAIAPIDLKKKGLDDSLCQEMAESVYKEQQRLLVDSPITLDSEELKIILGRC